MSIPNALLDAALAYARRGWPVFPCRADTKAPLVTGGLKSASVDVAQIRAWWQRWPNAMIGLPLGGATGLFALDFDPREDMDPETGEVRRYGYVDLKAETEAMIGGELPPTAASRTPSGGFHVFYRQPEGEPVRNRGNLPRHVDVRGEGGYVIAPPSMRADGVPYAWVDGRDPDACPPVEAPAALVRLLRSRAAAPAVAAAAGVRAVEADEAVRRYALAAMDREIDALRRLGRGGRNDALNRAALSLGSLAGAGALSEAVARAALLDACAANGLLADDGERACLATIDSGFKAGLSSPRDLSDVWASAARRAARGSRQVMPPRTPGGAEDFKASHMGAAAKYGGVARVLRGLSEAIRTLRDAAFRPETDVGNAERWHMWFGGDFRYTEELGWLSWDGMRWKREGGDPRSYPPMLGRSAIMTVRGIQLEADFIRGTGCPDPEACEALGIEVSEGGLNRVVKWAKAHGVERPVLWADAHAQFGRACESSGRIGAIAGLARLQPGVSVASSGFDCKPMLFNCISGTLEFRRADGPGQAPSVVLRPHDRGDLITKLAPVAYDPAARAPVYDGFLARVQPDAGMRRFLHAWAGYTLTGDVGEQCFVILHGTEGGNGKSTWELVRAHVMGDYAQKVNVESFLEGNLQKSGAQASPDIARLPGARMVYTSEPKQGQRFAEDLIKVVTGSETITARHLNRDFFEFQPEFKISVACNRPPEASDDKAFWRRVRLTPWDVSVPEAERDKSLPARMEAEASGILNHMIAGALDWMAGGLPVPDEVREATQRYQEESDPLGRFIGMALVVEQGFRVQSSHLFDLYRAWCRFTGEKEWTQTGFSKALTRKGHRKKQSSNIYWEGLRPRYEAEAFVELVRDQFGSVVDSRAREAIDEGFAADPAAYAAPGASAKPPAAPAPPVAAAASQEDEWVE